MMKKKWFPFVLMICFFLLTLCLHAETSPLMMFGMGGERNLKADWEDNRQQNSINRTVAERREEENYEVGPSSPEQNNNISLLLWAPSRDEVEKQLEDYKYQYADAKKNRELEKTRNLNKVIMTGQYARECLKKMDQEITQEEKTIWGVIARCSLLQAEAQLKTKDKEAEKYALTICSLEDAAQCFHGVLKTNSLQEQKILQKEAAYHRKRAFAEVKGNRGDAQELNVIALTIRNALGCFQRASQIEHPEVKEALVMAGRYSLREAELRKQKKGDEMRNMSEAVFAAEQAATYRYQAAKVENILEKKALQKAGMSSWQRAEALATGQLEKATDLLYAIFYAGDARDYFEQAFNPKVSQEKQREYYSKGLRYLEIAELYYQHNKEQALQTFVKNCNKEGRITPVIMTLQNRK